MDARRNFCKGGGGKPNKGSTYGEKKVPSRVIKAHKKEQRAPHMEKRPRTWRIFFPGERAHSYS